MESALTTVPPVSRATASASADLPEAVGPAMRTTRPGSFNAAKTCSCTKALSVSHVATLISSSQAAAVTGEVLRSAGEILGSADQPVWLHQGIAADVPFRPAAGSQDGVAQHLRAALGCRPIDVVVQPTACRRKRLFLADMDSTMI